MKSPSSSPKTSSRKRSSIQRWVAFVIVAVMGSESIVFASGIPASPAKPDEWTASRTMAAHPSVSKAIQMASRIPAEWGRLDQVYAPSNPAESDGRCLILLQDAHANPAAQFALAGLVEYFVGQLPVRTVFTEAGSEDESLSQVTRGLPRQKVAEVSERFVRQGWMKGAEYAQVRGRGEWKLWGVENSLLYRESLRVFAEANRTRPEAELKIARYKKALRSLEERVLNPRLLEFERLVRAHREGVVSHGAYFKGMNGFLAEAGMELDGYPALSAYQRVLDLESGVDFVKAGRERDDLAARGSGAVKDALKDAGAAGLNPAGSGGLNRQLDLYQPIAVFIREAGEQDRYGHLIRYIDYLEAASGCEAMAVVREQQRLESALRRRLTLTDIEAEFTGYAQQIRALENLAALQISAEELVRLRVSGLLYDPGILAAWINRQMLQLDQDPGLALLEEDGWRESLRPASRFYELAAVRDRVFVRQIDRRMRADDERVAVLVVGGFHAEALKGLFKQSGTAFVSVLPQVTHETDRARYEKSIVTAAGETQLSRRGGTGVSDPSPSGYSLMEPLLRELTVAGPDGKPANAFRLWAGQIGADPSFQGTASRLAGGESNDRWWTKPASMLSSTTTRIDLALGKQEIAFNQRRAVIEDWFRQIRAIEDEMQYGEANENPLVSLEAIESLFTEMMTSLDFTNRPERGDEIIFAADYLLPSLESMEWLIEAMDLSLSAASDGFNPHRLAEEGMREHVEFLIRARVWIASEGFGLSRFMAAPDWNLVPELKSVRPVGRVDVQAFNKKSFVHLSSGWLGTLAEYRPEVALSPTVSHSFARAKALWRESKSYLIAAERLVRNQPVAPDLSDAHAQIRENQCLHKDHWDGVLAQVAGNPIRHPWLKELEERGALGYFVGAMRIAVRSLEQGTITIGQYEAIPLHPGSRLADAAAAGEAGRAMDRILRSDSFESLLAEVGRLEAIDGVDLAGPVRKIRSLSAGDDGQKLGLAKRFVRLFYATRRPDGTPEGALPAVDPSGADEARGALLAKYPEARIEAGIRRVQGDLLATSGEGEAPVVDLAAKIPALAAIRERAGVDFDLVASLEYRKSDNREPTLTGSFKRRQFINFFLENPGRFSADNPRRVRRVYINSSGNAIQGLLFTVKVLKKAGLLPEDFTVVMVAHNTLNPDKKKKIETKYPGHFGGILFVRDFIAEAKALGGVLDPAKTDEELETDLEDINALLKAIDLYAAAYNRANPDSPIEHVLPSNGESMVLGGASIARNLREGAAKLGLGEVDLILEPLGGGGPIAGAAVESYWHRQRGGHATRVVGVTSDITVSSVADGMAIQAPQSEVMEARRAFGSDAVDFERVPEELFYKAWVELQDAGFDAEPTSAASLAYLYWILADPARREFMRPGIDGRKKVIAFMMSGANYSAGVLEHARQIYARDGMARPEYLDSFAGSRLAQEGRRKLQIAGIDFERHEPARPRAHVLITEAMDERAAAILREHGIGYDMIDADSGHRLTSDEVIRVGEAEPRYDAILSFTNQELGKSPLFADAFGRLKSVNLFSRGSNQVGITALAERGIPVTNIGNLLTEAMAEQNIGMLLEAHYGLFANLADRQKDGRWVNLANLRIGDDAMAQILWGLLMGRVLKLDEMYRFGRSDRFNGAGVAPGDTVLHDQLATKREAGIQRTIGIVGNDPIARRWMAYAKAHGVHQIRYFVPESARDLRLEQQFDLLYTPLTALGQSSDYLIVSPSMPLPNDTLPAAKTINPDLWWANPDKIEELNNPLNGKRLGIQGLGNIGTATARRAAAFGLEVSALVRNPEGHQGAAQEGIRLYSSGQKTEFLRDLEQLILIAPLNDESKFFLDARALASAARLKVLINTGRGDLLVEQALADAWRSGRGFKARLDVLSKENGFEDQILAHEDFGPYLEVSGHTGSAVRDIRFAMQRDAILNNLIPTLDGQKPANLVTASRLAKEEKVQDFTLLATNSGTDEFKVADFGANVVSLKLGGRELLWHKENGQKLKADDSPLAIPGGMPFMFPWTSRIQDGILVLPGGRRFNLKEAKLARRTPDAAAGPDVLHGITDKVRWKIIERTESGVTLALDAREVPLEGAVEILSDGTTRPVGTLADVFGAVTVRLTYAVRDGEFLAEVEIQNHSETQTAALSFGHHPFYRLGESLEGWKVQIPASGYWQADARQVPLKQGPLPVDGTELDFREPKAVHKAEIGLTNLSDSDGRVVSRLFNEDTGEALTFSQDRLFRHAVYWVPEGHAVLPPGIASIQPTTSSANALNMDMAGISEASPVSIAPGQTLTARWGIQRTAASRLAGWSPLPQFDGKIEVHSETGRIRFAGEAPIANIAADAVYWVRHGETLGNREHRFQGALDEAINQLTERGREGASQAAEILYRQLENDIRDGAVIVARTSVLSRSIDTLRPFIDLVNERTGIDLMSEPHPLLMEISFGRWDGLNEDEIQKGLGEAELDLVRRYREGLDARGRPAEGKKTGESALDVLERGLADLQALNKELAEIRRTHPGKKIIFVGSVHGTQSALLRVLLGDRGTLDASGDFVNWRSNMLPNTQPVVFDSSIRQTRPLSGSRLSAGAPASEETGGRLAVSAERALRFAGAVYAGQKRSGHLPLGRSGSGYWGVEMRPVDTGVRLKIYPDGEERLVSNLGAFVSQGRPAATRNTQSRLDAEESVRAEFEADRSLAAALESLPTVELNFRVPLTDLLAEAKDADTREENARLLLAALEWAKSPKHAWAKEISFFVTENESRAADPAVRDLLTRMARKGVIRIGEPEDDAMTVRWYVREGDDADGEFNLRLEPLQKGRMPRWIRAVVYPALVLSDPAVRDGAVGARELSDAFEKAVTISERTHQMIRRGFGREMTASELLERFKGRKPFGLSEALLPQLIPVTQWIQGIRMAISILEISA